MSRPELVQQLRQKRLLGLIGLDCVTNPLGDLLEKVEIVIETAFKNPKLLRFRDYYSVNTGILEGK